MTILDLIAREDKLRSMCAEVYGSENASWHAQRLACRYESDFREIQSILISFRSAK